MLNTTKTILAVCCLIVIALFLVFTIPHYYIENPAEQEISSETSSANTQPVLYIVRSYEGKLSVFNPGESKPFEILDINVDSLPLKDRELLNVGINITSKQQLRDILEDYDS